MRSSRQHTPRQPFPSSGRLWKDVADERREAIEDLARTGKAETRRHVATQDGTPPDILDDLALDPVASVAAAAVANRWTSGRAVEAAWEAAKKASPEYQTAVARGIVPTRGHRSRCTGRPRRGHTVECPGSSTRTHSATASEPRRR